MSALFGALPERRQWTSEPPIPSNGSQGNSSFAKVDLRRTEASLQKVAIWACVNLVRTIAEMLPLDVFAGEGSSRHEVAMPTWLADLSGDSYGLQDWASQVVYSEMLRGNVVGLVADQQTNGKPSQIVLQHPDAVSVRRDMNTGRPEWYIEGKRIDASRVWHRRVNSVPGQIWGLSPIEVHALTIGAGLAATRYGAQWFEEGAHPSGVLSHATNLRNGEADTAKQRFMAAIHGRREPVVLGGGWTYTAIQVNPNESQFLETNQYTSAECCRIFGPALAEVFAYDTGGGLTYRNIEQRSIDLLTYAADPWLVRLERMLTELLPAGQYARFNRAALVRTDLLTRYKAYEIALWMQYKTINEVRSDEDLPPVSWGNQPIEYGPGRPSSNDIGAG